MKCLIFILLVSFNQLCAQTKTEQPEDYINRLWSTADTNALKASYNLDIIVPDHKEPTLFEQQLILQRNQHDHEWEIEHLRMLYQDVYYQQYYFIRRY